MSMKNVSLAQYVANSAHFEFNYDCTKKQNIWLDLTTGRQKWKRRSLAGRAQEARKHQKNAIKKFLLHLFQKCHASLAEKLRPRGSGLVLNYKLYLRRRRKVS